MLNSAMKRLFDSAPLESDEGKAIVAALIDCDNETQIAATLALCNTRNENDLVMLIFNLVQTLRQHLPLHLSTPGALDIVGTGGDNTGSLNISTATALLLASAHIPIAKHGNRSVSSRCGSADLLEALGFDIQQRASLSPYFSFYFAPAFQPVLKKYTQLRKQLAVPTIFNYCGPLLNPARPTRAIIGVHDPKMLPIYARLCPQLGFRHVLLVHTQGMDELSCVANPQIIEIDQQRVQSYSLDIQELGLSLCQQSDLAGGDAPFNATVLLEIFSGLPHPARDTLILNVAAGCYLFGLAPTIARAIPIARAILAEKQCLELIKQLQEAT